MTTNKTALRREMKRRRASVSEEERAAQNAAIARQVLSCPVYQRAKTIFCYCSVGEEIDTYPILRNALQTGKRLCLPRTGTGGRMEACAVSALEELTAGRYGIPEPGAGCPPVAPQDIDLCIVPCLAADRRGFRMGYGGGYYDRYLPRTRAVRLLLCAGARVLDAVPTEEYDVPCDILLTESQVICLHEK